MGDASGGDLVMKKDDPCVSVCQFDGRTGWCVGCGRTLAETRAWQKLTPYRLNALIRELPRRMARISDRPREAGRTHEADDEAGA